MIFQPDSDYSNACGFEFLNFLSQLLLVVLFEMQIDELLAAVLQFL